MTLRRLKWLTVVAPVAFFGLLVIGLSVLFSVPGSRLPALLLMGATVLLAAALFSEAVFGVIGRLQARLTQQNQELLALHQAGLDVAGDLSLETVLQKIVEQARELVGARYGALSVPSEDGGAPTLLIAGMAGAGNGAEARLRRLLHGRDQADGGPKVGDAASPSLLAMPIESNARVLGNLYLVDKVTGPAFSADDEETVSRFATQAALAVENARLHRQVRDLAITEERERIAREMHDSLAQVLGYVNTKAQAAQQLLQSGQTAGAERQIGQLAEAARAAYADVREGILGLRTSLGPERALLETLRDYLSRWQEQSGVPVELVVLPPDGPLAQLAPAAELQLVRIIQEALANVRKHAGASCVRVELCEDGGCLRAVIEDDGTGFNPASPGRGAFPRFGLATMRERAESVGGGLEVESAALRGTRVVVRLPTNGMREVVQGATSASADR